MSIENPERLEKAESWLKTRLWEEKQTMRVDDGHGNWKSVTLLEIYAEWMDYLVKNNFDKKEDNLLKKWKNFLLERNTDAIADLLVGFFEAKRRYGRDQERNEDKRSWFALCKNYCEKWWWDSDENLLLQFFSSYSAAERRVRGKMKEGKILWDASLSLLESLSLAKEEKIKKEEEKKRKAEEKLKKAEEKKKRAEEREKRKEEKAKEKNEKKVKKSNVDGIKINNSDVIESSDWDEEDKEVDPDYPKAPEWWSGPIDPGFSWPSQVVSDDWDAKGWEDGVKNEKEIIIRDEKWNLMRSDGQYLLDFPDFEDWK